LNNANIVNHNIIANAKAIYNIKLNFTLLGQNKENDLSIMVLELRHCWLFAHLDLFGSLGISMSFLVNFHAVFYIIRRIIYNTITIVDPTFFIFLSKRYRELRYPFAYTFLLIW